MGEKREAWKMIEGIRDRGEQQPQQLKAKISEIPSDTHQLQLIKLHHFKLERFLDLTRFNKIATQGAPQMAVDKEANSLSRVYSYYSKFNLHLCLFYV